ncbi:MAG: aldo/keto reductase, partial [Gaiellales bacterium]
MEQRRIERLGRSVSCVGFGAWQLGADWGDVPEEEATAALEAALAEGVTFIDTADASGDGRSERIIGRLIGQLGAERPFVATKMGRRVEQRHENYTPQAFRGWIERSRENLGLDTLDLV